MGDIADQIINGEICQMCCCGEGEGRGYPYTCSDCDQPVYQSTQGATGKGKCSCPICNKRVRKIGLQGHVKDCHPEYLQKIYKSILNALKEGL